MWKRSSVKAPSRRLTTVVGLTALAASAAIATSAGTAGAEAAHTSNSAAEGRVLSGATSTPIKHLVVIFQENVSFDHYFGTYPHAANLPGEPQFHAAGDTPAVNGLSESLLTSNPNLSNPQRLGPSQSLTCDQDHGYTSEQKAFDGGLMDQFVQNTGHQKTVAQCTGQASGTSPNYAVMDYYDGNTVTGLWNYAQHFAMSDNSYGTNFGPSTPGAINVSAGNTYGAICGPTWAVYNAPACTSTPGSVPATPGQPAAMGPGTDYSDADPSFDVCSNKTPGNTIQMGGENIGDLLSKAGVTWGWFQGGFASAGYVPGKPSTDDVAATGCNATHQNIGGNTVTDYIPHHEPFQYYASTANPLHTPPSSISLIGTNQDGANHQYDMKDFWAAADSGHLPSVSYLKAPAYQDGHAGYSDPTDEQHFLIDTINHLEKLPTWSSTAVVINYDDSDGWYDHVQGPVDSASNTALDALTGPGACVGGLSALVPGTNTVPTTDTGIPEEGRCGVGPRLPMLVISPYAKSNYVDHTETTQTSVVRFIEDNWLGGARIGNGNADIMSATGSLDGMFDFAHRNDRELLLDPWTGEPGVR